MRYGTNKNELMIWCFNSIERWNDIAGFLDKPVDPNLEYNLLLEEVKEYFNAAISNNEKEVKDALADIMVVLYGTILKHKLKDDFWEILKSICDSNNTKWCRTEEEAQVSVNKYNQQGIEAYYVFNEKHEVFVIKRKSDNKTLKSINYKEPKI